MSQKEGLKEGNLKRVLFNDETKSGQMIIKKMEYAKSLKQSKRKKQHERKIRDLQGGIE